MAHRLHPQKVLAVAALLNLSCTADLYDLCAAKCVLRLNGVCNEPEICEVGGDIADCSDGPYGACHDLLTGAVFADRCRHPGDSLCIPGSIPATSSICTRGCSDASECPTVPGHDAACEEMELFGTDLPIRACALLCDKNFTCPDGMLCRPNNQCAWVSDPLSSLFSPGESGD